MIDIIKSKSHMIGKLFVFQIASSLLGLFVASPFSGGMLIAAAIFSTLFYYSLVAYAVIEDGQKDFISVSSGRSSGKPYAGFVYALAAYLPTIVIVLTQMTVLLLSENAEKTGLTFILGIVIRFLLMGMYLGFESGLTNKFYVEGAETALSNESDSILFICDTCIFYACLLIVMPIVCGIVYKLAYHGKIHVDTEQKKKK